LASLTVTDLSISIAGNLLVDKVSFSVAAGEKLCLLGASGSGKSITACAILGQLPPNAVTSGSILIGGQEVLGVPLQRRSPSARASMVFQDSAVALNPLIPVGQQLSQPFRRHQGMSKADAASASLEILQTIGIADPQALVGAFPSELSGGQRQRVCIALAIACRTGLLVADEPTTALDVVTQEKVLAVLRRYASAVDAPALLFITHDIAVAASICDAGVVLHEGHIVEQNSFSQLIRAPRHPFTQSLVQAARAATVQTAVEQASDLSGHGHHQRVLVGSAVGDGGTVTYQGSAHQGSAYQDSARTAGRTPLALAESGPGNAPGCKPESSPCNPDVDYLSAENVTRSFLLPRQRILGPRTERVALNNVSIQIGKNECVGLVGSSGSGKTTLLKALLALDRPTAGQITCDGRDVAPGPLPTLKWYRKVVQYVPQDPATSLDFRMTVRDLIHEPLVHLDVPCNREERITSALDAVGLSTALQSKKASELSGGQAQRVAMARALAIRPQFLLADEPVSGLDLPMREQVIALLQDICRNSGMGLLVVSHDISMVASLCERTVVIHAGEIIEDGVTSRVLTDPKHPTTRDLLDAIPSLVTAG
jgi:peptide/nickel transport system ATP-binding protein